MKKESEIVKLLEDLYEEKENKRKVICQLIDQSDNFKCIEDEISELYTLRSNINCIEYILDKCDNFYQTFPCKH